MTFKKNLFQLVVPVLLGPLFFFGPLPRAAAAEGNKWTGNANVFSGAKALDEHDWTPADEQNEFGFETDFRKRGWPVSIELDFLGAAGSGSAFDPGPGELKMESRTSELNVGIRKTWDGFPHVRPYVGGGLTFAGASAKISGLGTSATDSDRGTGLWLGGGVYWTLGAFNIGFDLRGSSAKVTIFNVDTDAGGGHFGLLLGYHWGGPAERYKAAAPVIAQPQAPAGSYEKDSLELEKQRLEIEKQRLELEREKLEFEKQKLQKQ